MLYWYPTILCKIVLLAPFEKAFQLGYRLRPYAKVKATIEPDPEEEV